MKKAVMAVLVGVVAGPVFAQSSFVLYGRVDNGIQYQNGLPNGHLFGMESGYAEASLFGLKGNEDLGGGTSAIFQLEAAVDTLNGQSLGTFFGHTATVGLSNDRLGTFRLGDLETQEIQWDSFTVDPQLMLAYSIVTLVRGRNWSEAGNGFKYTSPNFGGFLVEGEYDLTNSTSWNGGSPGSGPGTYGEAQGRADGVMLRYTGADVELQLLYNEVRNTNGKFDNVYVASRSILSGGTFVLGPVRFYAGYQHLSASDVSNEGYFGTAAAPALPRSVSLPTAVDQEWLGFAWQATSYTALRAACYHANANNGNGNATLYTLSFTHNLSKSTYLYSEIGYVRNSSTSNVGLNDGATNPYGPNENNDQVSGNTNTNPDYGKSQLGMYAGVVVHF